MKRKTQLKRKPPLKKTDSEKEISRLRAIISRAVEAKREWRRACLATNTSTAPSLGYYGGFQPSFGVNSSIVRAEENLYRCWSALETEADR